MTSVSTSPIDTDGVVRCFAHNLEASLKTSRSLANPNRQFYCCPKQISDPERCKFFYWADRIEQLHQMSHTPLKRTIDAQEPETPSQKRLRLMQQALDQSDDGSHSLLTPPSISHRTDYRLSRAESPSPLPRNSKGKEREHADDEQNELDVPSSVDYSISQEFRPIVQQLQDLRPKIERLERFKAAGDKGNIAKQDKIDSLMNENDLLKQRILAQEKEIRDLKKMNKVLLDTRPG